VAAATAVAQHLPAPVALRVTATAFRAYTQGMSTVLVVCGGLLVAGALLMLAFLPARAPGHSAESVPAVPPEPVAGY
jgi:hypothetical protein